jgi:hypothetical protein
MRVLREEAARSADVRAPGRFEVVEAEVQL